MFGTMAALLAIGALAWVWVETLRIREVAQAAGRTLCRSHRVQFLDDTVALTYIGLPFRRRGEWRAGKLALRRVYQFEFSRFGDDRERGSVTMIGHRVESLYLPELPLEPS